MVILINGDDFDKRIQLIFLLFDFDKSGELDPLEFILSCKAVIYGMCKLNKLPLPPIKHIEKYAKSFYRNIKYDKNFDNKLSIEEIKPILKEDYEI